MINVLYKMVKEQGRKDAFDLRKRSPNMTQTAIIDEEEKIPDFVSGKDYTLYERNVPVKDDGQIWLLLQPYDSSVHHGKPSELRALWGLAHTKNPNKAKPFVSPLGTSGIYFKDECCTVSERPGKVFQCCVEQTNFSPVDYPAHWIEYNMEV